MGWREDGPLQHSPLSQVLCVFLLNFLQCISVQPLCREEEYSVGGECCPMCNPGRSSSRSHHCAREAPVLSLLASGSSADAGCTVFSPGIAPGSLYSSASGTFAVRGRPSRIRG